MASIYFPLSPLEDHQQLEEGDLVDERDVRRLLVLHRRAAKATPLLLADGWDVWYTGHGLEADHPDVASREEAMARLAIIGVPFAWVQTFGALLRREVDGDDGGPDARPTGD